MAAPSLKRRDLLAGLVGTVGAISGCMATAPGPAAASAAPQDEWARVRDQFALSRDWLHLGGFLLASHPKPVRDAIEAHRRGLDENPVDYLDKHEGGPPRPGKPRPPSAEDRVRASAATYMGAHPGDIALTDSTTMGLGMLYSGLPLRSGDEIVTTTHDHYATHESLRFAAERSGATVRKVPLYERAAEASAGAMADAIAHAITPATRVVAVTWVHSGTGVRVPVRRIADAVASANGGRAEKDRVLLCVDGVHGFGVEDASTGDLGCDFFVAGCHKWMFGPRGTGVVWGKPEHWQLLRPTVPHFGGEGYGAWIKGVAPPPTNANMMTPGGFHSFEHRWALAQAFDFHLGIGKPKVAARIHDLNRQCKEGLAAMRHVTLHTPRAVEISAGIICFEMAGLDPEQVVARLRAKRIIATTTPYATSYARVAPGLLNSPDEIETVLREIRALA